MIIELNGIEFEVTKPRVRVPNASVARRYDGWGLETVYNRPSHIKELIWAEWKQWSSTTPEVKTFGVSGGNCNCFSITGTAEIDGKVYVVYITASHNRLILAE